MMIKQSKIKHIVESNAVVFYPVYEGRDICKKIQDALDYDLNSDIERKLGKVTKVHTLGKLPFKTIIFVGLGKEEEASVNTLQTAIAAFVKSNQEKNISVHIRSAKTECFNEYDLAAIFSEALTIAGYEFTKINAKAKEEISYELVSKEQVGDAIEKGVIIGEAVNHARNLGNMPSNYMTPLDLADYAKKLADECNLEANILTNKDLEEIGAGGILGVNQGSALEARLIVLKYNGAKDEPYTAFVGKGLTFDSGGYNLKSAAGMLSMKSDMCGAANVLGAIEIIAKQKLKANVYAIIPSTENMISGEAYNCDDVLVSLSKKTVEITNTDAEGRLILMDGITYAQQLGAKRVIDIATLTGAVIMALGKSYTGTFSNDEAFYADFKQAAINSNEKIWRLPLDKDYHEMLRSSNVADLVNSKAGGAGSSVAACFLEEFIEKDTKWIHLDIAGTSYDAKVNPLASEGATGAMAKTMAALFDK